MVESTTKNLCAVDAKNYKEGINQRRIHCRDSIHAVSEMKYTATYDSARGDGSNGAFL